MIMCVIYEYANVLKFITSGARDARTLQKSLLHAYILYGCQRQVFKQQQIKMNGKTVLHAMLSRIGNFI